MLADVETFVATIDVDSDAAADVNDDAERDFGGKEEDIVATFVVAEVRLSSLIASGASSLSMKEASLKASSTSATDAAILDLDLAGGEPRVLRPGEPRMSLPVGEFRAKTVGKPRELTVDDELR